MKESTQNKFSIAMKIVLTVIAFWLLLSIVEAVWVHHELALTAGKVPVNVESRTHALIGEPERPEKRPWPQFPGAGSSEPGVMTLNGVRVVSDSWETTASASEVLDYYRRQMRARGWADSTEETFGLDPESQKARGQDPTLQSERYLRTYRETMESALTMRRGESSFMVTLEPGSAKWRRMVRISIAATPTLNKFAGEMAERIVMSGEGSADRQIMNAEERIGNSTYHTSVASSLDDPKAYFKASLKDLRDAGWQEVFVGPEEREGPEQFAVLQRGGEQMYLAVTRDLQDRKSTRLLTRVSE